MKRTSFSTPDTSISMFLKISATLEMIRVIERLRNDVPLQRDTIAPIDGQRLVTAPADRTMVNDNVVAPKIPESVISTTGFQRHASGRKRRRGHPAIHRGSFQLIPITHPDTDVTDNHIVAADRHRMISKTNTIPRRRLACNRCIAPDRQLRREADRPGYPKNDRSIGRRLRQGIP